MPRKLFRTEDSYGEIVKDYYIDEAGQPFVIEERYEMKFYGMGDHIGTPGPLLETRQYSISYPKLRKAAEREGASAFTEIDETNWTSVLRAALEGRKRKHNR